MDMSCYPLFHSNLQFIAKRKRDEDFGDDEDARPTKKQRVAPLERKE